MGPPAAKARASPRRLAGDEAELVVARRLAAAGWTILARNVRVAGVELDIVAAEPSQQGALAIIEVRSRTAPGFGAPEESVDGVKVARLYRAARELERTGRLPGGLRLPARPVRVDLVSVSREGRLGAWRVGSHLRGLEPP